MIIYIFFLLVLTNSLECPVLYDYSTGSIRCSTTCPENSRQFGQYCCSTNQYFSNNRCQLCQGWVVNQGSSCCIFGQYWNKQLNSCTKCETEIYLKGTLCCKGCHYLDMTQSVPRCMPNGQGFCWNLTCTSQQKICCASGQYFNVFQNKCTHNISNLNKDQIRMIGCPNGNYLDYVHKSLICSSSCRYGIIIDTLLCASKYCSVSRIQIFSIQNPQSSLIALSNNRCCYSIYNGICITDNQTCINRYKSNQYSICCPGGQSYSLNNNNCSFICEGIIIFGIFCIKKNQYVDFSVTPPILKNITSLCNNKFLPPTMNVCCPKGFFSNGIQGCQRCYGNIFGTNNYQKCCLFNQIFNQTLGSCSTCTGIVDRFGSICCPATTYITYNNNGTVSCESFCDLQFVKDTIYCCLVCNNQNCKKVNSLTMMSPRFCSSSYFIQNSCDSCSCGTCSLNSNCISIDSNFQNYNLCGIVCKLNQIVDLITSECLDCDESCNNCILPLSSSNCSTCAQGYYNNTGNCQICYYKCKTCFNSASSCSSCHLNSLTPVLSNGNCVPNCLEGTYLNNDKCQFCNSQCLTCQNLSNCLSCHNSFYLILGSCQPCSSSCKTCIESANTCLNCQQPFALFSNLTCVLDCPASTIKILLSYELGFVCKLCDPACETCLTFSYNCISCKKNYYLNITTGTSSCFPCPKGCLACTNSTNCIGGCVGGYYLSYITDICESCHISCLTCNGALNTNCITCSIGIVLSQGRCIGCNPGCATCLSPTICTSCFQNYNFYNINSSCLNICPISTYKLNQICVQCPVDCLECNSSSCIKCNSNSPFVDSGKCVKFCNKTKFIIGNICQQCHGTVYNQGISCCVLPNIVVDNKCIISFNPIIPPPIFPPIIPPNEQTPNFRTMQQLVRVNKNKIYITLIIQNNNFVKQYRPQFMLLQTNNSNNRLSYYPLNVSLFKVKSNSITFVSNSFNNSKYGYLLYSSHNMQNYYSKHLYKQNYITYLKSQQIKYLQILSIIFSIILFIYALFSKFKGHYIAEQSNTLILHTINFCQAAALFQNIFLMPKQIYSFLQGFRFLHFSFFWNMFNSIIPIQYIEPNYPAPLVPDGNFLRQAGFSVTFQIFLVFFFLICFVVSYICFCCLQLEEPPFIRKILRLFFLLISMCFMNQIFCAVTNVRYHNVSSQFTISPSIYNGSFGASIFFIIVIPIFIILMLLHYYLTYLQDFDEHIYTFRQGAQLFQIYFQGLILGLSIQKYTTFLLILLEGVWLTFNIIIDLTRQCDYQFRLYLMSGLMMVGYLFLSLANKLNIGTVVIISLTVLTFIIYCTYQIVGIYYWWLCGCCRQIQQQDVIGSQITK